MKNFIIVSIAMLGLLFQACETNTPKKAKPVPAKDLDGLLVDHPDSIPLLIQKGQQLCDNSEWDAARGFVFKAYRLDSNNIKIRHLFAEVLNNGINRPTSDLHLAQYNYFKVINAEPKNTRALVGLASTYTKLSDLENSFKYINQALKVDVHCRDAYILKGTNYRIEDKPELVKSSYQTAIEQDPDFMLAYFELGRIYEAEKDEKCIEYFISASELAPNDPAVEYHLAYSLQVFDKTERAIEIYRHLATNEEKYYSSQALFQLGYIKEFYNENLDSAIYFYNSATVTEPKYKEAWLNMGICYHKLGNNSLALKKISQALAIDPEYELAREAAEKIR